MPDKISDHPLTVLRTLVTSAPLLLKNAAASKVRTPALVVKLFVSIIIPRIETVSLHIADTQVIREILQDLCYHLTAEDA